MGSDAAVTITLIHADRHCSKCAACQVMLSRLQGEFGPALEIRQITANDPEAARYGLVMPPMVIVDDFIAAAGKVPLESGLRQLVHRQMGGRTTS